MRSGEFNRLVTILTTAAAQDTVGQPTGAWSTLCTRWAKITYQSGIQVLKADSVGSVAKAAIRLRGYRTDILPGMQAALGATVFRILSVLPDEDGREFVDLVCEVVV